MRRARGNRARRSARRSGWSREALPYAHELHRGESFEEAGRAGAAAEGRAGGAPAGRAAAARHPRHLHPLLPPRLGARRRLRAADGGAGSGTSAPTTAALSIFAHGEARDPGGSRGSRLDLPQLDGSGRGIRRDGPRRVVGRDLPLLVDDRPRRRRDRARRAAGPRSRASRRRAARASPRAPRRRAGSAARLSPSAGSSTRS